MIDLFLLIGLPYLAIVVAVVGTVWRLRRDPYSVTTRSSQFLEDKQLLWGSGPWHIGIGIVLVGHIVAGFFPKVWGAILTVPGALIAIETIGVAASLLAIVGLTLLIVRRIVSARVQAVTTVADLAVTGLLLAQVVLGLMTALHYRYGAAWSVGTVVPYFWGLVMLRPDIGYVADFPMLFKLHLVGAWLIIALLPFTRLIHLLSVPVGYILRAPQLVIWSTVRRRRDEAAVAAMAQSRREFVKGAVGGAAAVTLLGLGVSEKLFNYFKGPRHDPEADAALLQKKLQRLQQTAEERELELERQRMEMIAVCRYDELIENKGKYFIDYGMTPGLAFKGKDGFPLLISAKCTHLGCTVGSETDADGRVLCPCHISYFNIQTGQPNAGAPAKAPLPHIAWAVVDGAGKILASKQPGQPVQGTTDTAALAQGRVFITKPTGLA
jgi:nitrate reductase gamma subunit